MRIDPSQVLAQGGLKGKADKGAFTDSLREGQLIKAEVLSIERDFALLKTEDGETFKARLDTDATMYPGEKIEFKVIGKEGGNVILSIAGEEAGSGKAAEMMRLIWDFDDKSLGPMASKLAELNMPVTEEAARVMRDIIAQNPGMTLDEAAFIASNKLSGEADLVKAAVAMLSDDIKTDEIIQRILTMLEMPEPTEPSARAQGRETLAAPDAAPLTDWLAQAGESAERTGPDTLKSIITHNDGNLQSTIVASDEKNMQNPVSNVDLPDPETKSQLTAGGVSREPDVGRGEGREDRGELGTKDAGAARQAGISEHTEPAGKMIAKVIAEIPEFRGTPEGAIERFSNMLLRVAGESADISGGDSEKLKGLIEKLFTRIEKNDASAGERLKSAKEELFARLALIEEAISRAGPPAKAEMIQQTRNLMDHVRLLNNIGQFIYMELPVKMGEEKKTAEVYLFKRKGGRRPDPENVNILLALDLENMGRWEALMNIKTKDVSIQMEVRGPEEKEFFSENTVLLHNMLDEAGFRLTGASVTYNDKETSPLTALKTLDRYTNGRGGSVDFRV